MGIIFFSASLSAQSKMTPKIKEFLTRNDILELIEKYGQNKIELSIKGVEQIKDEQRSYTVVQGYRCQVFASSQKDNANEMASKIRQAQLDSVYVIRSTDNLYKVQVGNFLDRKDALVMVDQLRYAGFTGAWVVETDIHTPKEKQPEDISEEETVQSEIYYAVQIFNTKYYDKAKNFKTALEQKFSQPVQIIQENDLWKIVIGHFADHTSASLLLDEMRNQGFVDAWVTQLVN